MFDLIMTEDPKRPLARMSTVGCILAILFVGIVLFLIYYN